MLALFLFWLRKIFLVTVLRTVSFLLATERNERFSREAIRPLFELLGERCRQIEAVAMDMSCTANKPSHSPWTVDGEPNNAMYWLTA